jgi:phage shock protein C
MSGNIKKLRRSKDNRIFLGVCGGIGEYLGIDPTIIRIIRVLLSFAYGLGFAVYFIIGVIMSMNDDDN